MPRAAAWCSAICNGFQILCEAGLLPGVLMRNCGLRFVCKMQHLRVETNATPFARRISRAARSSNSRSRTARAITSSTPPGSPSSNARDASRSAIATPRAASAARANPNGSMNDIAGVYNERFNVLGLMPHPENLIDPLVGGVDGRTLFAAISAVEFDGIYI